MRKNGSRLISVKQYRLTDLFLFALILVIYDLLAHFVPTLFQGAAVYSFCLTLLFTLTVMIRWGWQSAFFAVGDGVFLALLGGGGWSMVLSYAVGNAFMLLLLIPIKFIGKEKITSRWWASAAFVLVGWVLQNVGITIMQTIFGEGFVSCIKANFGFALTGLLQLAMSVVITLVLRRLNGMYEDQLSYLMRIHGEMEESKRVDEYGEGLEEIDEESLSILNKHNDMY